MRVLITGAGGFVGQLLGAAVLAEDDSTELVLTDVSQPPRPQSQSDKNVRCLELDLTAEEPRSSLFAQPFDKLFLLHGIMSGGAEANFELGLKVNLDSMRSILDILCGYQARGWKIPTVVFPSSLAVFGPVEEGAVTSETGLVPNPQSSYGSQKLIVEVLVNDFSRRGFIDGRVCRLPTIVVRPGAPSAATSSFASAILREPLKGDEAQLPVPESLKMWICSPKVVVKNLVYAGNIPASRYTAYKSRTVNLPGITVSVHDMLDALKAVGGESVLKLVKKVDDPKVKAIVESWPDNLQTQRAKELGFLDDQPLSDTVRDYYEGYVKK